MPPVSKAQARFMGAVIGGKAKAKGLGKAGAREFLRGSSQKGLPEKVKKKKSKSKSKGMSQRSIEKAGMK